MSFAENDVFNPLCLLQRRVTHNWHPRALSNYLWIPSPISKQGGSVITWDIAAIMMLRFNNGAAAYIFKFCIECSYAIWNESNKWKCKDLPDIPIRTHLVSANKPFVFCLSSRTPTSRQSAFADYYQIQVKFWRKISFWNKERNLIFRWAMNQDTYGHLYLRHQTAVIFILGCSLVSCVWQ